MKGITVLVCSALVNFSYRHIPNPTPTMTHFTAASVRFLQLVYLISVHLFVYSHVCLHQCRKTKDIHPEQNNREPQSRFELDSGDVIYFPLKTLCMRAR